VPQILKYGDFFALIKDLCMPFTTENPEEPNLLNQISAGLEII
jgi:hypothetical protein